MADKKKKGRRAYLSDYVMDVSGQYVYNGAYYNADAQGKDFSRVVKGVFGLVFLAFAALVAVGCLSTGTTSGAFYVTLPHAVAIILSAVCLYDSVIVLRSKGRLKEHQYDSAVPRLKGCSIAGAVCAFVAAAGQLGYTVLKGEKATRVADIVFFAGCLVAGALLYMAFATKKQILWQKDN